MTQVPSGSLHCKSFARGEVVAPAGLWERGAEASGSIPPSARLFRPGGSSNDPGVSSPGTVVHETACASKALATSPSGEIGLSACSDVGRPSFRTAPALDRHASSVSSLADETQAVVASQTGLSARDAVAWAEAQQRRAKIDSDTRLVADTLRRYGMDMRRKDQTLIQVGLVTGAVSSAVEGYQRSVFLPSVAASIRREMVDELEHFLKRDPKGRYARYVVITSGQRCIAPDLRWRIQSFNRKISKWRATVCKAFGIDVLLRALEFPWEKGKGFHVHSNVILVPRSRLSKGDWADFFERTRHYFGSWWRDNGRLSDVREAVKYCIKGDDLMKMCREDPNALANAYVYTRGLHLVQPMGAFREWRSELKADRKKVVAIHDREGNRRLVVIDRKRKDDESCRSMEGGENQVISISLPSARFSRFKEPVALIANPNLDRLWGEGSGELFKHHLEALEHWRANGAPDPRVALQEASEALANSFHQARFGDSTDLYSSHEHSNCPETGAIPASERIENGTHGPPIIGAERTRCASDRQFTA
ncbi:hypothetical protein [Denitrobaculum tricleocarpae]|uniref:Uncharacterized protein n=1 Tax=Denitrobaculum tricleocarpae TaxID=2591009 RepID=A0A545TXJ6_9PROT|nr:hypothetical protein [Denitrobaculum tricleocarpae]TQV81904.1 hypothetical protein FKG95_06610 [Denitrobaculum tricleocarpae]